MEQQLRLLKPSCPRCGATKEITVPESLFAKKQFGFIKIQVPKGAICANHQFIVIADAKGFILGYEEIDLSVSKDNDDELFEKQKTLNKKLGYNCIAGLIHAKLFNYPAYIIRTNDPEINMEDLNRFFNDLMPFDYVNGHVIETMKYDEEIFPHPGYFYSLVQQQKPHAFLMNPQKHIIQIPWRTTITFEQNIVNFALGKEDESESYKWLANSLSIFVNDAHITKETLESIKKITEKDLIKLLDEKLTFSTINKYRMALINEFIYRRMNSDLLKKIKK
jgi:uncharacterized protein (UPF0297 family)